MTTLTVHCVFITFFIANSWIRQAKAQTDESRISMPTWSEILSTTRLPRDRPNELPQCQCVMDPTTGGCFMYDTSVQAESIHEAVYSFQDLTLPEPVPQSCESDECHSCRKMLENRLKQLGLLKNRKTHSPTEGLSCEQYSFTLNKNESEVILPSPPPDAAYEESSASDDSEKSEYRRGDDRRSSSSDESSSSSEQKREYNPRNHNNRTRYRRNSDEQAIGIGFPVACVTKGTSADSQNPMVSLCTKCWTWRQLPSNYFPRYINEMTCHSNDVSCLSGFAECNVAYRPITVLVNDTGSYRVVTLETGTFCECQVMETSGFHAFVVGKPVGNINVSKFNVSADGLEYFENENETEIETTMMSTVQETTVDDEHTRSNRASRPAHQLRSKLASQDTDTWKEFFNG